jgi:hypothetical protein
MACSRSLSKSCDPLRGATTPRLAPAARSPARGPRFTAYRFGRFQRDRGQINESDTLTVTVGLSLSGRLGYRADLGSITFRPGGREGRTGAHFVEVVILSPRKKCDVRAGPRSRELREWFGHLPELLFASSQRIFARTVAVGMACDCSSVAARPRGSDWQHADRARRVSGWQLLGLSRAGVR